MVSDEAIRVEVELLTRVWNEALTVRIPTDFKE